MFSEELVHQSFRYNTWYLTTVILFLLTSCHQTEADHLSIATAANIQFAMKELSDSFTSETGIDCHVIIGSSGKLTAQIKEGAPYDVFVSANMKYPQDLYQSAKTLNKPKVYALGKLVLLTLSDGITPSIDILENKEIKHIATANPELAPYGKAAIEVLEHYQKYTRVKDKLVFGESIAQTNQFITSQAADIGFTAKSVVLSPQMIGKGSWIELDQSTYQRIEQGVVLVDRKQNNNPNSVQFFNFLFSEKAKSILEKYGYQVI